MPHHAIVRMDTAVVPAFYVKAVNAEDLELRRIDLLPNGVDHAGVFVFEEAAPRSGEDQDGLSSMAISQQLHVPAKSVTIPIVIIAAHAWNSHSGSVPSQCFYITSPAYSPAEIFAGRPWTSRITATRNEASVI